MTVRHRHRARSRLAVATVMFVPFVAGCGSASGAQLAAASLDLPSGNPMRPLGSTTMYTSPDGGIYRNPDHVDVTLVSTQAIDTVAQRTGQVAAWQPLHSFGPFAVVGLRVRNDGKAGSDPALNDLQLASDLAPDGTASGPLHHFYHPMFTLAVVSDLPIGDACSVHLDPGQTASVLLVYPPIRPVTSVLWGRYDDFSVHAGTGGGLSFAGDQLFAAACTPPPQP
jgi:hypothetical protein